MRDFISNRIADDIRSYTPFTSRLPYHFGVDLCCRFIVLLALSCYGFCGLACLTHIVSSCPSWLFGL